MSFRASFHHEPAFAVRTGDVDMQAKVDLTIVLRPGAPLDAATHCGGPGMSRDTYKALHGTPEYVIDRVREVARRYDLSVVSTDAAAHVVKLRCTYAQAIHAFMPEQIGMYENATGLKFAARTGRLTVPHDIAGDVVAVMGLDQRPVATPHLRPLLSAGQVAYTPLQVAARYQFPAGDGTGQTIALIELGGGYTDSDVAAYFSGLGVNRTGSLTSVGVGAASNAPDGNPGGADGEVQLDIEVTGAVAPAADIVVYFGSNAGVGFHDAISAAVNDASRSPGVISISWGGPENSYAQQDIDAIDQVLAQAATLGITVCVACGDSGSTDGVADGQNHVDFPASSANVIACGGTSLPASGPEVVWNNGAQGGATGGGFSSQFAQPAWQMSAVSNSKRGVPDVAGDADPATGYQVSVDGTATVIGGTSAVAPLMAGLVALVNQSLGRKVGFISPLLYANPTAFTDIVAGSNGAYQAGPGWDAATGLGTPLGTQVLAALQASAPTS